MKRLLSVMFVVLISAAMVAANPVKTPRFDPNRHVYSVPEGYLPSEIRPDEVRKLEQVLSRLKYPFVVVITKKLETDGESDLNKVATDAVDALAADLSRNPRFDRAQTSLLLLAFSLEDESGETITKDDGTPRRKFAFLAGSRWKNELGFEKEAHKPYTDIFTRYVSGTPKEYATGAMKMAEAVDAYLVDQTDPVKIKARQEEAARQERARKLEAAQGELDGGISQFEQLLGAPAAFLPKDTANYRTALAHAKKVRVNNDPASMLEEAQVLNGSIKVLDQFVGARRSEAEALRKEQEAAQGKLDDQILAMKRVLEVNPAFLPSDRTPFMNALEQAKKVRAGVDYELMRAEAVRLAGSVNSLSDHVSKMKTIAYQAMVKRTIIALVVILLVAILILWLSAKIGAHLALKVGFAGKLSKWKKMLENAERRYLGMYGERGTVIGIKMLVGKTKDLYDRVTSAVDEIQIGLQAIRLHVEECEQKAAQGMLRQANKALESSFLFDTGKVNEADLFGSQTKQVTIDPVEFTKQLERRFATTVDDWNRLKEAAEARGKLAEELFSQSVLDAMCEKANVLGIPLRWLSDHPLFGDAASDKLVNDHLNELRLTDPIAYMEEIDRLRAVEGEISQRFNRLVAAVNLVASDRMSEPPSIGTTVLLPKDDPMVTFDAARRAEADLAGLLAGARLADVELVEAKADEISDRYRAVASQAARAKQAIAEASETIAAAEKLKATAAEVGAAAEARLKQACTIHRNTGEAQSSLANGQKYHSAADPRLARAKEKLAANRHSEARKDAFEAQEAIKGAQDEFTHCIRQCEELDQAKQEFERKVSSFSTQRATYEQKIRRYGRTAHLDGEMPTVGSVADYAQALAVMTAIESSWADQERRARRAYEEEESREREEAEHRRRRAEEEAESRRRQSSSHNDYYSSSSSSYSSSSGSDYSSSSSGDMGGGGSSASAGDM